MIFVVMFMKKLPVTCWLSLAASPSRMHTQIVLRGGGL
jgi:hypothetical protein